LESLKRKYSLICKEINIFDKKAEEATINLIVAQEELDWTKDLKKTIEFDVEKIKSELISYLRRLKANNFDFSKFPAGTVPPSVSSDLYLTDMEQKKLIAEQRIILEALNNEINSKKAETNSIKDQSQMYLKQLKNEIDKNESHLSQTKKKYDTLQNEINEMKKLADELSSDSKLKQQSLADKRVLIETLELSIKKFKQINQDETNKLDDIERRLQEKYNEYENIDKQFKKLVENINELQVEENELLNTLEKLNNNIKIEKETYEKLKELNDELNLNKCDLESRVNNLSDAFDRLNDQALEKEHQMNKFNDITKEKQVMLKKQEDHIAELDYQKENLNHETNLLKEKYNRKKTEFERLEQNLKQINEKFNQTETETTQCSQKIFEAKQQYEKMVQAIKEADFKLKELTLKIQNKQHLHDQVNIRRNMYFNDLFDLFYFYLYYLL
jgi:myosin heavy subunit